MKVLLFANTDWYLFNFRRSLAMALQDAGFEVLLVSPPGPYGERLTALGFRWIPAPMSRRSLNPLRELQLILWLQRLLLREQVNLVHGFTIKNAVYGSLAARLAGIEARINAVAGMGYVYTSNDAKARVLRPVVNALMRLALKGTGSRLILQNPDDVAFFERTRLAKPDQIRLIMGSGVDCQRFVPAPRAADVGPNSPLRVLLPARLLWDKGIAEFVEATRQIRRHGRNITFLLAGDPDDGNPAAVSELQVKAWQQEGLLRWLGHVDDMPGLFSTVDVVVLPSYREGLPKGLIEACACGLPIVTTDVPGCREVVSDGENGFLVPVKNPEALAAAISALDDDVALRRRMGARSRERALAEFDERIILAQTVAVYKELLT